jgi:hypothetical protein
MLGLDVGCHRTHSVGGFACQPRRSPFSVCL